MHCWRLRCASRACIPGTPLLHTHRHTHRPRTHTHTAHTPTHIYTLADQSSLLRRIVSRMLFMLACYIGMPSLWLSPGAIAHAGPFSWLHHTELRWPELYDEPWGPLRTHTHTLANQSSYSGRSVCTRFGSPCSLFRSYVLTSTA